MINEKNIVAAVVEEPEMVFYYMRDNHTFKSLTGDTQEMIYTCIQEVYKGYSYGTLFGKMGSKTICTVHCNGLIKLNEFMAEAATVLNKIFEDKKAKSLEVPK